MTITATEPVRVGAVDRQIERARATLAGVLALDPGEPMRAEKLRGAKAALERAEEGQRIIESHRLAEDKRREATAAMARAARPELDRMGAELAASGETLSAALAAHNEASAELLRAADAHNAAVGAARARLLELGILAEDADPDGASGHGLTIGGKPWTPVRVEDAEQARVTA